MNPKQNPNPDVQSSSDVESSEEADGGQSVSEEQLDPVDESEVARESDT